MTWNDEWDIKIDGTQVNRNRTNPSGSYVIMIPELENTFEQDVILVEVDGDYPAYVRTQPREGQYTIIIQMTACDWSTYQTRLQDLKTKFSPGVHTLTVKVRGMASEMSVKIVCKSILVDAKQRLVTVMAVVPKPVLT